MRSLLVVCVVACLALTAGMASAASPGEISDNALAQMGLSGLQPMSDAQGTEVRGMGFAAVWGWSYATMPGTFTKNSYVGVSMVPYAEAGGSTQSYAAGAVVSGGGWASDSGWFVGGTFMAAGVISGGGATAWAK